MEKFQGEVVLKEYRSSRTTVMTNAKLACYEIDKLRNDDL